MSEVLEPPRILDFSVPDWEERLLAGRSLIPDGLPLNHEQGERGVAIFNNLRLPDVPGKPFLEEAGGEWFREIVYTFFGAADPVARSRFIRELLLMVPKKNSKTTNAAGIMMTALIMNQRPRAEFILVAPTKENADTAFSQAAGMIEADEEGVLQTRFHVRDHLKRIESRVDKSALVIKAFDKAVVTGVKPAGVLVDEVHEIAKERNAAQILGQLTGGIIADPLAFVIYITTQSDEPPRGVWKELLLRARKIRAGKGMPGDDLLPILYEFPRKIMTSKEELWRKPDLWHLVTPNLGRSIQLPRLVTEYGKAVEKGDAEVRRWASQHLNIEIGIALGSDSWAGAEFWEPQADATLTLEELLKRSEVIVCGIDGGGLDDLLALCVMGRDRETGDWLAWHKTWMQPVARERRKSEASRYDDFAAADELLMVQEVGEDILDLAKVVQRVWKERRLHKIGVDTAGIAAVIQACVALGVPMELFEGIRQGWELTSAIKATERKLAEGAMWHAGQGITAWAVGNAKVEPRGNAVTITKQTAGAAKIDPLMATLDAAAIMQRNPKAMGTVGRFLSRPLAL